MNLLTNPNFLLNNDTFHFGFNELQLKYGKDYKIVKSEKNNYYHEFDYKSNFSPTVNDHVSVVEYIEGDPVYLNGFGMPSTLFCYTKHFDAVDHKRIRFVDEDESLPMLLNLFDNTVLIQETNLFCSVLVPLSQDKTTCTYILSFVGDKFYIIEPTEVYVSGHIQPKIECIFTIPKQEQILFDKQRHRRSRKRNTHIPLQIKSAREFQVKSENRSIQKFFKYLMSRGNFHNENNILIVLYTTSCFIMHDDEMKKILKKIENFVNDLKWTQSLNFFSLTNESKLGKHEFLLQMLKICRSYFDLYELRFFDEILLNYIKNFNETRDKSQFSSYNYVANIEKKKFDFIKTKKEIVRFLYFLEYDYLINNHQTYDKDRFEVFLNTTLKTKKYCKQITDTDLEIDLILNDTSKDYDYKDVQLLKYSEVLDFYSSKRNKKKRKRSSEKTKTTQIRFSKIFFESSHMVLKIHPQIKAKLSNPYKVFMNKRRKTF